MSNTDDSDDSTNCYKNYYTDDNIPRPVPTHSPWGKTDLGPFFKSPKPNFSYAVLSGIWGASCAFFLVNTCELNIDRYKNSKGVIDFFKNRPCFGTGLWTMFFLSASVAVHSNIVFRYFVEN